MTITDIVDYCLSKNGAYQDFPFGFIPICFKVCNRLFLELYPKEENFKITVKCEPIVADFYRQQHPNIVVVGYHCPDRQKPYKNTVYLNKGLDEELVFQMIDHSYNEVVKYLKKKDR